LEYLHNHAGRFGRDGSVGVYYFRDLSGLGARDRILPGVLDLIFRGALSGIKQRAVSASTSSAADC
jgi:hypothetical protein